MSASAKEIKVNVTGLDGIFKNKEKVMIPEYQCPQRMGQSKNRRAAQRPEGFLYYKTV
jgi:hypothetical protein